MKMKIKATLKDNSGNIIEECEDYPRFSAWADYLRFDFPFFVDAMKKGKYTLSLTITQSEPFDYSKVQKMEILFIQPSYK